METMSQYRRARIEGGWFFFTVTLANRSSDLLVRHIERLRNAYAAALRRDAFETIAICILPDHLHAIRALPPDDADFSRRWSLIKHDFSRGLPDDARRSRSKCAKREKGIWQRRFWEHAIRDERDLSRHVDYIHFNPVKHGLVSRACDWRTVRFIATSHADFCRSIGVAMSRKRPAVVSANDVAFLGCGRRVS